MLLRSSRPGTLYTRPYTRRTFPRHQRRSVAVVGSQRGLPAAGANTVGGGTPGDEDSGEMDAHSRVCQTRFTPHPHWSLCLLFLPSTSSSITKRDVHMSTFVTSCPVYKLNVKILVLLLQRTRDYQVPRFKNYNYILEQ